MEAVTQTPQNADDFFFREKKEKKIAFRTKKIFTAFLSMRERNVCAFSFFFFLLLTEGKKPKGVEQDFLSASIKLPVVLIVVVFIFFFQGRFLI